MVFVPVTQLCIYGAGLQVELSFNKNESMAVSLLPKDFGNLQLIQNYSNFSAAPYKVECFTVSLAYSCQSFPFTHRIHVTFTKKVLFISPRGLFPGNPTVFTNWAAPTTTRYEVVFNVLFFIFELLYCYFFNFETVNLKANISLS